MQTAFLAGATSEIIYLNAWVASTGLPYTAGAFNTAGITAIYVRQGAASTSITLATQTAGGAYSSGGFVHIGGGLYRLDLPNAALTSGVDYVQVKIFGIADVVFEPVHIEIMNGDPRSSTVSANLTQIAGQTANAAAAVTFPSSIASPTNITAATGVTLAAVTHTGAVIPTVTTTGTATNVTTVNGLAANVITATSIQNGAFTAAKFAAGAFDAVWTVATRSLTTFGTLVTDVTTAVWAAGTRTLTGFGTLVTNIWDVATSSLTTVGSIGRFIVDNTGGGGGTDWTVSERNQIRHRLGIDGSTAAPTASPSLATPTSVRTELATELGRIDATVSSRLASAGYTVPPTASANASAVRTELSTELARIDANVSSRLATGTVGADLTAVKAKTDLLTFSGGNVNANIEQINNTQITGNGSTNPFDVV